MKAVIDVFLRRKMEEFDTMGCSEEKMAEEDWQADAADLLENEG
ncbi:hypothetical protein [Ruminiclostridium cellobioparum]|nr:hypothetical protein [Ruminiclostridium cellobioparum]